MQVAFKIETIPLEVVKAQKSRLAGYQPATHTLLLEAFERDLRKLTKQNVDIDLIFE